MTQQRPPKRQNRPLALIHARLVDPAGNRVCLFSGGESRRFPPVRVAP